VAADQGVTQARPGVSLGRRIGPALLLVPPFA
jgi:hypothetical protein